MVIQQKFSTRCFKKKQYIFSFENCDRNSRLVVDEDDNGIFRLERVNAWTIKTCLKLYVPGSRKMRANYYNYGWIWQGAEPMQVEAPPEENENVEEEFHVVETTSLVRSLNMIKDCKTFWFT